MWTPLVNTGIHINPLRQQPIHLVHLAGVCCYTQPQFALHQHIQYLGGPALLEDSLLCKHLQLQYKTAKISHKALVLAKLTTTAYVCVH